MSDLSNLIIDTSPASSDTGVALLSDITITLSGLNYDYTSLSDGFFLEGPDTDQYVGPGLISLTSPANISQGDIDDFLKSPGYQGLVLGSTTVTGLSGNTVITFDPTYPLAPLTDYVANLTSVLDATLNEIDGYVTLSFTSGSGSIEAVPSTISTSILAAAIPEAALTGASNPFKVIKVTPLDHSIENDPNLTTEIVLEFNKSIDSTTVSGNVTVQTIPATDHPNASTSSLGDISIVTSVVGNKLTIEV